MFRRVWILMVLLSIVPFAASADTLVLSDFENEQELARFIQRGVGSFAVTADRVAHGDRAARLIFPKWQKGTDEWPAVALRTTGGLPTNWSNYDLLAVTVRNESKCDVDLAFYISDTEGQSTSQHFIIPSGKTETLRYRLDNASVRMAAIREMHLFATRPPEEFSLVIDHLRLEEDLEPRLASLEEGLHRLERDMRSSGLSDKFDEFQEARRLDENLLNQRLGRLASPRHTPTPSKAAWKASGRIFSRTHLRTFRTQSPAGRHSEFGTLPRPHPAPPR